MTLYSTACPRNCYSTCAMKARVEDGRIIAIEADPSNPATAGGPCLKGLSYIERTYSKDRLTSPMERQADGTFKPIPWEMALYRIVGKLRDIRDKYGAKSVFYYCASGTKGLLNSCGLDFWRAFGGCTTTYGDLCWPAGLEATRLTLGDNRQSAPWDIAKAKLIVMWGKNPAETNIHQMRYIEQALKDGARYVVIDPRRTQSAEGANLLIQPNPGTDGALALGLAHLILLSRQYDADFVHDHVLGFEEYVDLVCEWTPERTVEVTGIPEPHLRLLAQWMGEVKPMSICAGFGMQRYSNAGQTMRALIALCAITGNIGIPGGGWVYANLATQVFGGRDPLAFFPTDKVHLPAASEARASVESGASGLRAAQNETPDARECPTDKVHLPTASEARASAESGASGLRAAQNETPEEPQIEAAPARPSKRRKGAKTPEPVDTDPTDFADAPSRPDTVDMPSRLEPAESSSGTPDNIRYSISTARLGPGMLEQRDPPLKFAWVERGNPLHQNPQTHTVREAFRALEFRVVVDDFLTETALEADLVLPAKSMFEQTDVVGAYWHAFLQLRPKLIAPPGEVMPETEIYWEMAKHLDIKEDVRRTFLPYPSDQGVEEWLERRLAPLGFTLAKLREGPVLAPGAEEVAFADRRFTTPSGRIELLSQEAAKRWQLPEVAQYSPLVEGANAKHPLHLLAPNTRNAIHSQFHRLSLISALGCEHVVQMHPEDAAARHLKEGQEVRVFNDRGEIRLPLRLDYGLRPGVVVVHNGLGGVKDCVNQLSAARETDMGYGAAFHDNAVQVEA